MIHASRETRRLMERENAKRPATLRELPHAEWPEAMQGRANAPRRVWLSRHFLVQEFAEPHAAVYARLSVNRTTLGDNGRWREGITWDELQEVKAQAGYADRDAVEVYPAVRDLVDVASIRHLWLMAEPLSFKWGAKS